MERYAMAKKNNSRKEPFSFFTVKENVTTADKVLMGVLFGLLFLAIAINKMTGSETVPFLLLACMTGVLCLTCLKQLKEPMTKRKARACMALGLMSLAITFVILYFVGRTLILGA